MNGAQLVTAVIDQAGTDATRPTVLGLLNEAYRTQVVQSRYLLETVSLGNTAAGTGDYTLPDSAVDILGLRVGNYEFTPIDVHELWDLQSSQSSAAWTGTYGYYALTYSSSGGTSVTLWPTPDTSGTAITVLTPATATDLTDSTTSTPITPIDTHGSLIDGTVGLVLLRVDERPDLAGAFFQRFDAATEELRRRKNRRPGGRMQAKIYGVHWR